MIESFLSNCDFSVFPLCNQSSAWNRVWPQKLWKIKLKMSVTYIWSNKHFIKMGCNSENSSIFEDQNHLQTKFNLHIAICQNQFTFVSSLWNTLYYKKVKKKWKNLSCLMGKISYFRVFSLFGGVICQMILFSNVLS